MDRKTLLDHESSWGREPRPASQELTRLTEAEKLLYEDLRFNRLGEFLEGEGFATLPPR